MKTSDAYKRFIIKINENSTTDNLSCSRGRFTILFNDSQNKLIEHFLDKRYEDDIRYVQSILVPNKELTTFSTHSGYQSFELPQDFFDLVNAYANCTKGSCTNKKVDLVESKSEDLNYILSDEFNKPSFKYREAPYSLNSNNIILYNADEFKADKVLLSYYRYPSQIGLTDSSDPESTFNNTDIEFDDKFANRVISLCASNFLLSANDEKFQAEKINAAQKI